MSKLNHVQYKTKYSYVYKNYLFYYHYYFVVLQCVKV